LTSAAIEALGGQADKIAAGETSQWSILSETLPPSIAALLPGGVKPEAATGSEPDSVADKPGELTLKDLVREELSENLAVLTGLTERISRDRSSTASDAEIIAIHTIAGTTALNPLSREPDVAKALEGFLEAQRQSDRAFNDAAMWTVASSLAHFETCLAVHDNDPEAELADDEESQIEQLIALTVEFEVPRQEQQEPEPEDEGIEDEPVVESSDESEIRSEQEDQQAETVPEPVDGEILAIFLEEATDILERCDSLLNTWRDDLSDLEIVQNLQREIHTFKGGARMAGINALGALSHSMETLLERIAGNFLPSSVSAIEVDRKSVV
jgi:chemosensory pili system protein ChpA (sensor histidine kinase/response regulator)